PGVEAGGILQVIRRELEVLCLPLEVPKVIEIDISALEIGDSIHLDEVALPANIEVPADVNFTVLTILSPMVEEVEGVEGETEAEAPDGEGTEQEA
ncbi:MAG: 50S ribosomal protein L25, partial [Desulfobacterales bacterium]|nr:50S ribosomal protein L25 [Desulfobacterales bacterium]